MKKRLVTAIIICFIVLLGYAAFFFTTLKDDEEQIRDEVRSVYGEINIVEIKMSDEGSSAIVIFERGFDHLGAMTLSKSWFEWEMQESSSERLPNSMSNGVFYREYDEYTVLAGKIGWNTSNIKIYIGEEREGFSASITELINLRGAFWYFITESGDLSDAVVKVYDEEGNVIAEMDEEVFNGARVDLNN
ncbi:hypothetical protein HXA35_01760 [Bacillus sp. A301a_S52]|nr:hypothetical protein [Bacillus sp. A301a_S52]